MAFLGLILYVFMILIIYQCYGFGTFKGFRSIEYDSMSLKYGSRKTKIDFVASPLMGIHDLGKNIGIIKFENITLNLLKTLKIRRTQSILIILPNNFKNINQDIINNFVGIESYLFDNNFDLSIYFTFNNNDMINTLINNIDTLYDKYANKNYEKELFNLIDMQKNSKSKRKNSNDLRQPPLVPVLSLTNNYQLIADESTSLISGIKYTNLFGILRSSRNTDVNRKYILITANHDSFGVVPLLSFGANDNGSGVTGLMSLLITFSKLYNNKELSDYIEKYDIIFLLSAGGYQNFEGIKQWLSDQNNGGQFIPDIELILCLTSLSNNDNKLYIHSTNIDTSNDVELSDVDEDDTDTDTNNNDNNNNNKYIGYFKSNNITEIIHKPKDMDIESTLHSFNHEAFIDKEISLNAITLSGKDVGNTLHHGSSILDSTDRINKKVLTNNIKSIINILTDIIYDNNNDIKKYINYDSVSHNINNYIKFIGKIPRFGPYNYKSGYISKLYQDLKRNTLNTKRMKYRSSASYQNFYSTNIVNINVYLIKPFIFDLIFLISNLIYLFIFFLILKQPRNWDEFMDLFASD